MALNYVTLILDGYDGGNDQLGLGTISFTPSVQLSDPTDHQWIPPAPVSTVFRGGLALPQVSLLATDNANINPAGWGWTVSFQNVPGSPAPFSFFLPFSGGATQYLSAMQPTASVVTMQAYLPVPTGTPTSGYVPVATGSGEATVWGPNGTGGSGYPALPTVSGTPSTGQVLTATSSTTADWQTPSGGGGSVNSVTAGDTSIVIGGSASNPTVETGTLDVIATDHPPAAAWSNNSKKITSLANGSGAQDAAAFGQIPTSASSIGGLLAANNLSDVSSAATSRTNLGLGAAALIGTPVSVANGGTGQATAQAAMNALAGAQTSGDYLRGNGTNVVMAAIQAGDVPTLNQNTTGTAANITDTLDQVPAPAANVSLNSRKITSLANGSAATDAAAYGQTLAGGDGAPLTTLGDLLYENSTPAPARLAGNTSATKNFLTQTGNGTVSAAPAWGTIAAGDVPVLNQNTTGSAASCTGNAATATNLAGGATLPDYLAPAVVTLTDASTISVNAALGNDFEVTLGASRTMGAPSNPVEGQKILFAISQPSSGGPYTVTWTSSAGGYSFGASGAPTLSTSANALDVIGFRYSSAKSAWLYLGSQLGF